jgi:succinate dehydrogenase / fumarate reductase iron-sulfur subunit
MTGTRRFRIHRFDRESAPASMQEHDVPVSGGTTVLEALRWIQRQRDPSLSFRHSCFHASCGTCGVRVNGREGLACVTPVEPSGGTVTIEPLANLPVLTDLVVDMGPFAQRFPSPHPLVRGSEFLPEAEPPDELDAYVRFEDCIECGLCLSACPVAATDDTYVGPAALAYAQRVLEGDVGATDRDSLLDWADRDNGAWRCHAAFECTEACPSDVRPAQRIMQLRKELRHRRRSLDRPVPPIGSDGDR